MKESLRKVFSPILNIFESGTEEYAYKPSHRVFLIIVGLLFGILASGAIGVSIYVNQLAGLMPGTVFLIIALVCEIVALLGNDRAVAKIWKSK